MDSLQPKGRGACSNVSGRFEGETVEYFDDGWEGFEMPNQVTTHVTIEHPKHIITKNASPDIPFDRSINAYRGCEHGCIYCFARPSHAFMGLSPGLDFETRLFAKPNAAELLRNELAKKAYKPEPIAMGTNTDPYQPIEREYKITRQVLEVLLECKHPVTLLSKSALMLRDMDIIEALHELNLIRIAFSVTSLDAKLSRTMEPRASSPQRRLDAIRQFSDRGIPVSIMFAPVIPALNDHEMESVLEAVKGAGAVRAAFILLRLPLELHDLFDEWLASYYPNRRKRVMNRLKAMRGGKANDQRFGHRMKGVGVEADLLKSRFLRSIDRFKLNQSFSKLERGLFEKPLSKNGQFSLF
ncbi:PA0069 family radical SAM protein [Kordiimonas sp. SCSIO 12610]|uniref:PA0069 family radical SAM protein n=1 Tax=Kordiimonas sp. SCSIO 12610 TaxID=2829597 RepID=UPI00210C3635|nr:PA0069 family radical SAM protein [Kordiimonas sp. SCSIO 12610]UTW54886.1 PA0069 family radical SAM protein [Kordiimonas sp. SCSIO 12610]